MTNFLCVPIELDALYLPTPHAVVEAHADFSRLPYVDKSKAGNWFDVNSDTPYLSEEILSKPLEDEGLYLQAGIHLHWALPDALIRGLHTKNGMQWPTVPNRWLVTRGQNGKLDHWIVESDYLHPEGINSTQSITFPINPATGQSQPYRRMGRQLPLNDWLNPPSSQPKPEYLSSKLTSMGYGDPSFAVLYPNCHSVFGFYDTDANIASSPQYDVIGWYATPEDDFLNLTNSFWLQDAFASICVRDGLTKPDPSKPGSTTPDFSKLNAGKMYEALQNEFGWEVKVPAQDFPQSLICYASLVFKSTAATEFADQNDNIKIAVGNTGTEALSAYLAATTTIPTNPNKATVEDQLEALLLQSEGKNHQLDWAFKFREARHEKGFRPFSGGTVWSIRPDVSGLSGTQNSNPQNQEQVSLPIELAHLLNTLNQKQQRLDRANDEADDLRRLLYADWCKYQRCAYPPEDSRESYPSADEVRYFIQEKDIVLLQNKLAQIQDYTTSLRVETYDILYARLQNFNHDTQNNPKLVTYQLQATPAERYWRANDPVLLLAGPGLQPTTRHGQDGSLDCKVLQAVLPSNADTSAASLRRVFDGITSANWTEQPWNPYLLEWEVELMPLEEGSNLDRDNYAYVPDYMDSNFELKVDQVDLTSKNANFVKAANIYTGRSILTPQANDNLSATLKDWLDMQGANSTDPAYPNIRAVYDQLQRQSEYYQSQSLGGFHEALLMQQQTYQLPLQDPLAFDDHQPFVKQVADLIGNGNRTAPEPLNDFNPIRTGFMRLLNLRLVDTFGQTHVLVKDGSIDQVITADTLAAPSNLNQVFLPPRLAQPARFDFYWRAATGDDMEMNSHPATSPVCGWLLPNNLDDTLLVYEQGGGILGWIEKADDAVVWQPAPGTELPIYADTIPNPYLQNVVNHILDQSKTKEADGTFYFDHFMNALNSALENIDPQNFAQHESLALLMGRPIAVARASLNLELKGLPAIDHDWNRFRQDIENIQIDVPRSDDDFINVQFPIRLGDYRQLNDGLVGYWVETPDGFEKDTFYSPQSTDNPSPNILTHGDPVSADADAPKMNRSQSLAGAPETYTMLLDPRGVVHAHCGILPARILSIPSDQFSAALKAIEVFFLSTPILTPTGQLTLPLPAEPGFAWSWLERQNGSVGWQEASKLEKTNLQANFPAQQQIVEGWLKLRPDDSQNPANA